MGRIDSPLGVYWCHAAFLPGHLPALVWSHDRIAAREIGEAFMFGVDNLGIGLR
jgi:hypothetical protein